MSINFLANSKSDLSNSHPLRYSYHVHTHTYIFRYRDKIHNSLKIAQLNWEQLSVARISTQPRKRGGEEEWRKKKGGETEGIHAYVTKAAIRRFERADY